MEYGHLRHAYWVWREICWCQKHFWKFGQRCACSWLGVRWTIAGSAKWLLTLISRAIFNWVSKCPGLHRLCSTSLCDWSRKLAPLSKPIRCKLKLIITTWSPAFSRAFGSLFVSTLSSHWLYGVFFFLLIGCCEYFGFGLTTFNRKALLSCISNRLLIINSQKDHLM